jgi:hypothetical protein
MSAAATPHGGDTITIHIDREEFKVHERVLTGAELRRLPDSDIGPDRDLYLTVKGPGDDRLIEDDDRVELEPGMHFFTAPRTINPGAAAG